MNQTKQHRVSDLRFLCTEIARIPGRIRKSGRSLQHVQDHINDLLRRSRLLEVAPFRCIHLTFYLDETTDLLPRIDPIDKRFNEIPVSVQLGIPDFKGKPEQYIQQLLLATALQVIEAVAHRFHLPFKDFHHLSENH